MLPSSNPTTSCCEYLVVNPYSTRENGLVSRYFTVSMYGINNTVVYVHHVDGHSPDILQQVMSTVRARASFCFQAYLCGYYLSTTYKKIQGQVGRFKTGKFTSDQKPCLDDSQARRPLY
jgi:hypothetical protein